MILHSIASDSLLSGKVDVLWYLEATPDAGRVQASEKVLPTGTFEFVFNLDGDRIRVHEGGDPPRPIELSGAVVCGVHSKYFELHGERVGRIAGVHFRPGGAYGLLRQPAAAFVNRHADLTEILGPVAANIRRELSSTPTVPAMFAKLEAFLIRNLDPNRTLAPIVTKLLARLDGDPFCNPVAALQREFGITHKGLIDVFKRQVGLTPKKLARVLRFQRVLSLIGSEGEINWAEVAHRCEYYDQAHFARDFRDFSGFSPGEYRARVRANPNHVPIE